MPPPCAAWLPTITLLTISASELLNRDIPPPCQPTLFLITLPLIVGVPAANRPTPPAACVCVLPLMTSFRTCTVPAPRIETPAPPTPPLQDCVLFVIRLSRIVAAENAAETAPSSQK